MSSAFVVATEDLPRAKVGGVDDPSVRCASAFATYGGHGSTQSSTIVYEIEPGGRLGWHTDATEETQYFLAGGGALRMEDARFIQSNRVMFSSSRRRCGTTSPTQARKDCGRSPSSRRRCSRSSSTM